MSNSRKHLYLALATVLLALAACRFGLVRGPDRATRTPQAAGREEGLTATRATSTVPPLITPTPRAETATPQPTVTPRSVSESPTLTRTPTFTPTPAARLVLTTPTPTSTPKPAPRLVLVTPTPTPTSSARLVVTTPTPTSPAKLVVTTPTPLAAVGGLPEPPDDGPLPALWIEIEFGGTGEGFSAQGQTGIGRTSGGVYYVQSLVLDPGNDVVYALGACGADVYSSEDRPRQCILAFDLVEDRVQPPGAVELPAEIQGESRLYAVGNTLYLHRRWAGVLHALDADTLDVRETFTDVYGIAPDRAAGLPWVVTRDGLSRLGSDVVGRLVARDYDQSPVDVVASSDRVYVLVDGALQVYDASLDPVATFQEEEVHLTSLALDEANRRLYVGSYDGLYVLDLATDAFSRTRADVGQVRALAVDPAARRLFALAARTSDWFGGTDVVAVDTSGWQTQMLLSVHSGQLSDLVYDADRTRLLVASWDDHALIPIDVSPDKSVSAAENVGQRLPLGIEVDEVAVGNQLYVSDSSGWVQVLDRHDYAEIGRVYGGRSISLDLAHGRLFAGDERVPVVSVYNTRTLELERVLPQAGKPRANPMTGEVVIVNRKFYVYDGASGQTARELLPGIGVPPAECPGCYYTIAREVTIDARRGLTATTTYTPWPGKPGPEESIDYDPVSGRATYGLLTGGYVRFASTAIYADLGSLQAREQPLLSLEGLGGQIRLDPAAQRLYVARGSILFVLDSETLNRTGRVYTDGQGPRWTPVIAAVDGELGRLYLPRGSRLLVWTRSGGAHPPALSAVPAVVTNTVASILPSPNYVSDGTLLATIDGQFVRSTDRGRTWQRLQGGLPRFDDYTYSVYAAFSPAYATDRRMFAGIHLGDTHGEGVYCSEDGGDTWVLCSDGLYDLRVSRVVPSPDFGQDRTLVAYARTQTGDAVYRSVDAGERWQLVLRQTDFSTPPLPRVEDFWRQREYLPRFRCDYMGTCERSDDGGGTWTPFDTGPVRLERFVGYAPSPQYARDGTVYFLTESDLYRYQSANRAWSIGVFPTSGAAAGRQRGLGEGWTSLAVAATGRDAHDLFLGSAAGEFYRLAASEVAWAAVTPVQAPSAATPSPTPCALAVDPRFPLAKGADISDMGCAAAPAKETGAAFQPFERGRMFWREDLRRIYVLQEDGIWAGYEDAWAPDQGEPDLSPPQGFYRPVRGFGRVWVLELDGPPSSVGWGTAPERGYVMVVQSFARGLLLTSANGDVYILYDDGTWRSP